MSGLSLVNGNISYKKVKILVKPKFLFCKENLLFNKFLRDRGFLQVHRVSYLEDAGIGNYMEHSLNNTKIHWELAYTS